MEPAASRGLVRIRPAFTAQVTIGALDRLLALDLDPSPPHFVAIAVAVASRSGKRAASPGRSRRRHDPLKAETRVRIPLMG
jgi:hypothetical protein